MEIEKFKFLSILSLIFCFLSLIVIYIGDVNLLSGRELTFMDENGDILYGTYYPGAKNAGVLLLEGFGSDQIALKSITSEFSSYGYHAFSFDFSGQGKSPGKLNFDNAATDRLAKQVLVAKERFKEFSGLKDDQIVMLGHSMGARMALQAATIDNDNVSGLVLLGTQVNLDINIQSSFFTGVLDSELEWVQGLSGNNPPVDILLISGQWDDIITPNSAILLYEKLNSPEAIHSRDLIIVNGLFHNYEVYSPEVISKAIIWADNSLGSNANNDFFAVKSLIRKIFWIIALITLFTFLLSMIKYGKLKNNQVNRTGNEELKILNINRYMIFKLILWFGALPIAILMLMLLVFLPIGIPIFNLIYVGFIGSYGILLLILYLKGRMPGTERKMEISINKNPINWNKILYTILIISIIVLITVFFTNSGIYFVFPFNERVIWLILLSILTIPGFFIAQKEAYILQSSRVQDYKKIYLFHLIGLFPFIIYTLFFLALGSISGMIGGVHGLIILILTITAGSMVRVYSENTLLTSIFQSFFIQFLVLPQGVLFAIF